MTLPDLDVAPRSALYPVGDQLQMSTICLHAATMGRTHGLDADALARLDGVVTEMATSIARIAGTGQIILRPVGEPSTGCIEILALDKGTGVADATRVEALAAIRALADLFDMHAHPDRGTAVLAHIGMPAARDAASRAVELARHGSFGVVCVPLHGEEECGDAWAVDVSTGRVVALLVDGLGHGPDAAVAARAAVSVFRNANADPPEIMLGAMHAALHDTRGAALSVAIIDQAGRTARFCGVGNVDGRVVTVDSNRHMVPQNGIVGHTMPRASAADVPWPAGGRLIMHSDGLSSLWRLDDYPGLIARHPALIAGVLFRDFARERDDATVLVIRDTILNQAD